jgi:hypothetical protein
MLAAPCGGARVIRINQPQKPWEVAMTTEHEGRPPTAVLEQAIRDQIVQRTGGRISRLEVEVKDNEVVIHGCAASYYLKQLALQGVLDVIGTAGMTKIELNVQVVFAPMSRYDAQ